MRYGYSSGISEMLGLATSTTDPLGTVSSSRYDFLGRIAKTSVANQAGVQHTYDKGELSSLTRTGGQVYRFTYDVFGNMTAMKAGDRTLAAYT